VTIRPSRLAAAAALAAAVVSVAACGGDGGDSLVVYDGQHPQLTQKLVDAFERETGIEVAVRSGASRALATQLVDGSAADVFLARSSAELVDLARRGLLRPLDDSAAEAVPQPYRGGNWVGTALRVGALVYNPSLVPPSELPRSILDLTEYRWQGRLGLAPRDSAFRPAVGAVLARQGESVTANWLEGLKQNARIYRDEAGLVAAVNRGDVALGLVDDSSWYRSRSAVGKDAMHSALRYFPGSDAGANVDVAGAAVLAKSRQRDAAERFVAFLVGEEGQRIAAENGYEYPVRAGIAANPALRPFAQVPHAAAVAWADAAAAKLMREAGLA
jgi:iron(III) transport system substrate-binding protein